MQASDGCGNIYRVRIISTGRNVTGEVVDVEHLPAGSPVIRIGVGLARRERLRWLVEKATELGVAEITPLSTVRSLRAPRGASSEAFTRRLSNVAVSALKQCKRSHLPVISGVQEFHAFLENSMTDSAGMLLDENPGRASIGDVVRDRETSDYTVLIGPEAGFDEREKEAAVARGFVPVSLGPARLRVETAALVVVAALRALKNEW